ncbi:hypothetical protein RND81_03G103400 [Saponaria officinalis]|uniref:Uncharacterized protein n=1 Tax=Saponaria officinalis TaxID=3572 RepID=A0AAW1M5V4_SAPOF
MIQHPQYVTVRKKTFSLCLPQSLSVHKDAEQKGKAKDEKRDLMLSYRMELNYITHVRVSRLMRFKLGCGRFCAMRLIRHTIILPFAPRKVKSPIIFLNFLKSRL